MRITALVALLALVTVSTAEARTVVKIEPNGVKTITMSTPSGVAVIQCDRNNVPISATGAIRGLDTRDICRRN